MHQTTHEAKLIEKWCISQIWRNFIIIYKKRNWIPLPSSLVSCVVPCRWCVIVVVPLMSYLVHTAAAPSSIPMAPPLGFVFFPLPQCFLWYGLYYFSVIFNILLTVTGNKSRRFRSMLVLHTSFFTCSSLPIRRNDGSKTDERASLDLIQPFLKALSRSQMSYC